MKNESKYDEQKCLDFNPFADDFGDPGDRTLSNKIVTLRDPRECYCCGSIAKKNTRCRVQVDVILGKIESYTWCEDCCAAMAVYCEGDGHELEKRFSMRDNQINNREQSTATLGR